MTGVGAHVAAALVVAAACGVPATAEPTRYLTLRGSSSGWVDVRLPHRVSFDPQAARYVRSGSVAGFYVRNAAAPRGDESTSVAGLDAAGFPTPAALGVVGATLPAGTYRFYLIADRAATVKIAVRGLTRDLTVVPRHHVRMRADVARVAVTQASPVKYAGRRSVAVDGGNRLMVTGMFKELAGRMAPVAHEWGTVYSCIEPPATTHCASADEPTDGLVPEDTYDRSGSWQLVDPGEVRGRAKVHQHYAGTARPVRITAAVVEMALR